MQRVLPALLFFLFLGAPAWAQDFSLSLRSQTRGGEDQPFERETRPESWKPAETAVIVCDMWDLHHCKRAVERGAEFAPRLDALLKLARERGATIIHAPSDCMAFYEDHPARKRAQAVPAAKAYPPEIDKWCYQIPAEEAAEYPLDQTEADDDSPEEHAAWHEELRKMGREPGRPWKRQMEMLTIDSEQDFLTDRGEEVWNILEQRGVKNVILTGVHVNMCVLGRPFGLRRMATGGKNVVLVRDLTDSMYNPLKRPFVDHFTGTDLIISHIERYVCPTITSDQFLGGEPFRFAGDDRKLRDVMDAPTR